MKYSCVSKYSGQALLLTSGSIRDTAAAAEVSATHTTQEWRNLWHAINTNIVAMKGRRHC
jgi:hypothetical protein